MPTPQRARAKIPQRDMFQARGLPASRSNGGDRMPASLTHQDDMGVEKFDARPEFKNTPFATANPDWRRISAFVREWCHRCKSGAVMAY